VVEQTAETYSAFFDTNVLRVLLSMKHELREMTARGSGSVINISSTAGSKAIAGASVYCGSKHAVEGITKAAALEVAASGVRVNAVAPGPIETGMLNRFVGSEDGKAGIVANVSLKRVGMPEEIAQAIVFISSDNAAFITGQILGVDGGKTAQ
jgi:NAD(P)-dependent dehydrogenase (short-subunit alcohol dehydrogenase family)